MRFGERISVTVAAGALLIGLASSAGPARAGYVVTLKQVGGDVDASGSGKIDLTGLSSQGTPLTPVGVEADKGYLVTGPTGGDAVVDAYRGFSGPSNFGGGPPILGTSGTGSAVGIDAEAGSSTNFLDVPVDYMSDTPLTSTLIFAGKSFKTLGLRPGTYEWKWGTGPDQNFTIAIGPLGAAVPESSTWVMMLLGFAALGFAGYRHGWKGRNAPDV
jgi:hypothetical protein